MSALPMSLDANTPAVLPARIAVLGLARSGLALAEALLERGVSVAAGDARPAAALEGVDALAGRTELFLGGPADPAAFLDGAGWLAVSPGVPLDSPAVAAARARGIPVYAEIEVAYRIAEAEAPGAHRWIAVTGTNGKSTTTTWIAEILKRSGRPVALAGNIGAPLSGFLNERGGRDFVCELSSFQLEAVDLFHPHVAVLTNITPDHLDRYAGFSDYAAAKARVFARQGPTDFAVVNADDPGAMAAPTRARRVLFSRRGRPETSAGTWIQSERLVSDVGGKPHAVLPVERLALPGAHNLENALAALAAVECLEVPLADIVDSLSRFDGLPHRTQLVAEIRGVRWVDDSKGTNVDATAKALEGFPDKSVVLILGGRDKHGDFASLAPLVARRARAVLTIGEAEATIAAAFAGTVEVERCGTMKAAVARASEIARRGDTVLLSPACASFDQYRNYEERGRDFAELVHVVTEIPDGA